MRNIIKEYLGLSDSEKQSLLETATIVFDTNVFLNLYRYSKSTRETLLDIMTSFKERLWMPYQIAKEFMKNRPEVIFETANKYENMISSGEKLVQEYASYLRIKPNDESCEELKKIISEWIETKKLKNLEVTSCSDDKILLQILDLFDGKVGTEFDESRIDEIRKEGKERYSKKVPPGYMDTKKIKDDDENNAYGDLIYWKEILEYANNHSVNVILVTSDQKEDWWTIVKGKTISPRPELLKEFHTFTSKQIYLYEMNNFISMVKSVNNEAVDEKITDEVEMVNASQIQPAIPLDVALIAMGIDPSPFLTLESQITNLHKKNKKRRNQIVKLKQRIQKGVASQEDIIAYKSNQQNLERDELLIHQLEKELMIGYNQLKD